MANKQFNGRFQFKHDIEANWGMAQGFTPLLNELIVYDPDDEHPHPRFKLGDGVTNINLLPFVSNIEKGEGNKSFQQVNDYASWAPDDSQVELIADADVQRNENDEVLSGAFGAFSSAFGGTSQATAKRAHAEGTTTVAAGKYSHTEGNGTYTKGNSAHAEGILTAAIGANAHSEGDHTRANGNSSHAEGGSTIADGTHSHAEGASTQAKGEQAHAEGAHTIAEGANSHAEGESTHALGVNSHAEGQFTHAEGVNSHAEGSQTLASGYASHAGGEGSIAAHADSFVHGSGLVSGRDQQAVFGVFNKIDENAVFAVGIGYNDDDRRTGFQVNMDGQVFVNGNELVNNNNIENGANTGAVSQKHNSESWTPDADQAEVIQSAANKTGNDIAVGAFGQYSFMEGGKSQAKGKRAHAEGTSTVAVGDYSHAEGNKTGSLGPNSHAEGLKSVAQGGVSHAEGGNTKAIGEASHAEGVDTIARSYASHVEGAITETKKDYSHAEGYTSIADGIASHAEGYGTLTGNDAAHAEGLGTRAMGAYAHAEGAHTEATGDNSHAEGVATKATAYAAHAGGDSTEANHSGSFAHGAVLKTGRDQQAVFGKFNEVDADALFVVGNGESADAPRNAFKVTSDGKAIAGGKQLATLDDIPESSGGSSAVYIDFASFTGTSADYTLVKGYIDNGTNVIIAENTGEDECIYYTLSNQNGEASWYGDAIGDLGPEYMFTCVYIASAHARAGKLNTCIKYIYVDITRGAGKLADIKLEKEIYVGTGPLSVDYALQDGKICFCSAEGVKYPGTSVTASANILLPLKGSGGAGAFCTFGGIVHFEGTDETTGQTIDEVCYVERYYNTGTGTKYRETVTPIATQSYVDTAIANVSNAILPGEGEKSLQQTIDAISWATPNTYAQQYIAEGKKTADGELDDSIFSTIQVNEAGELLSGAFGKESVSVNGKSQAIGKRSNAEGSKTIAFENNSHAEGADSFAAGYHSHAEGLITTALGNSSHAEGSQTVAEGLGSHAEGIFGIAKGEASHAEGAGTHAEGYAAHAEGDGSKAIGNASHAGGVLSEANHENSFAHGAVVKTGRANQTVFGLYNKVDPNALFVIGNGKEDAPSNAFSVGEDGTVIAGGKTLATMDDIPAQIDLNIDNGTGLKSIQQKLEADDWTLESGQTTMIADTTIKKQEGSDTIVLAGAFGNYASVLNGRGQASGVYSNAEGYKTVASGSHSHVEGSKSFAGGQAAHAEGAYTVATGDYSHAEGVYTKATGNDSHAEGYESQATQSHAHAEGRTTIASGSAAHSEGRMTEASGSYSHAEGENTKATGPRSHAGGDTSTASHDASFAHGKNLTTSRKYQTVVGQHNTNDADAMFIVGTGDSADAKANGFVVKKDGTAYVGGEKVATTADLEGLGNDDSVVVLIYEELKDAYVPIVNLIEAGKMVAIKHGKDYYTFSSHDTVTDDYMPSLEFSCVTREGADCLVKTITMHAGPTYPFEPKQISLTDLVNRVTALEAAMGI